MREGFCFAGNEKDVFFFLLLLVLLLLDREPPRGPLARRSSSLVEESSRFETRGTCARERNFYGKRYFIQNFSF